jgi:hypothetical protein
VNKNYATIDFSTSVAEPYHFDAAPAPVLLYTKPMFVKQTIVSIKVFLFSSDINCNEDD